MPMPEILRPINKVYIGQEGQEGTVCLMDISDSDLDSTDPQVYPFNGVLEGKKFWDKNGLQGVGTVPYNKEVRIQSTVPEPGTLDYVITIVTASSTNDNNTEDENVIDNNDATDEVTEE